jgi:phosphoglycerol transferase MdoB-like AlkP superfamily enzyme
MRNYFYHLQLFFYRFLVLLSILSISRFVFYLFNTTYFSEPNFWELIEIHIAGVRFDISALYYFNLLFILISIIPGNFKSHKIYQKIIFTIFLCVNATLLASNYIDTKFFEFENKRLTSDIFSSVWLGDDFRALLPRFIIDFWYLLVIWGCTVYLLYKFYPRLISNKIIKSRFKFKELIFQLGLFVLLMGLGVLGGRGGLQHTPLRVIHAVQYTSVLNIPLVLNTPFTIMKSIGKKPMVPENYFLKTKLDSIYSPIKTFTIDYTNNPQNIVILILEGFSKEYVGALNNSSGYTPFLDSLIHQSLVFNNAYANGKMSMEAIPSILAGLPDLIDGTYITSEYANNKLNSIPSLLKEKGYYSAFFHGGSNGTFGLDQFTKIIGFDDYFGKDEYPNQQDFDGFWGIYDEPYLQYFGKELSNFKQPFLASLFTLSSHHPYKIPEKYKNKFPAGNLKIHESIGYADYSLQQFFKSIENTDWYNNTLFVLVSDHTAQADRKNFKNNMDIYSIPIIFYHPTDTTFQGKSEIIAQQIDIFPTIMDYVNYDKPFICYGNSLLNESGLHYSINYFGVYIYIQDDYLLQFNGSSLIGLYNIKEDIYLKDNLVDRNIRNIDIENKLKAIIQSYQERIVHNQFTMTH